MENKVEVWKDVVGYEGIYQVSNYGNVKSLSRVIIHRNKNTLLNELLLKPAKSKNGYLTVNFRKNNKTQTIFIHQIVAYEFLGHLKCGFKLVVNHKDFNKVNNHVDNLEIVTARENTSYKQKKHSSIYTGVTYRKKSNRWESSIQIHGKNIYLGRYKTELEAHNAYQEKLNQII